MTQTNLSSSNQKLSWTILFNKYALKAGGNKGEGIKCFVFIERSFKNYMRHKESL